MCRMRRAACVSLGVLAIVSAAGSAAGAGASGWHVMPVRSLGKWVGGADEAAVNRLGTSIVVFGSRRSLKIARRAAHGSKFRISGRIRARMPVLMSLTALADDHFLLTYETQQQLLARDLDAKGRLDGKPHVLATGYRLNGTLVTFPSVFVDSDASRTVVVWGFTYGTTREIVGATDSRTGWSSPKVLYSANSSQAQAVFDVQLVGDGQGRFLVGIHGANGDTTAVMWGLSSGSQQWEPVTLPQATDGSDLATQIGATLAAVNGTITAAWQDASAALVVSTWNGSTWTTPVTAIAGSHANGSPIPIYPLFVSAGSRTAIVWSDTSQGALGRIMATIRTSAAGSWSAPLVFPHSRGSVVLVSHASDWFWFTRSGALAGAWTGDPFKSSENGGGNWNGLYVGYVSPTGTSATRLPRRARPYTTNRIWFALPRADGKHTIVWADKKGREFATTATGNGVVRGTRQLPACGFPWLGASNANASSQVVAFSPTGPVTAHGYKCPAVLVW